ncbi:MAG TPA: aspartate--tRNA ligase [Chloroflexota bacterium]|nr:aspartate--tRNA ligase [Chloroflexota bacterium]
MRKSHTCGELRAGDVRKRVTLMGWVHRRRVHGGLIFVDLRDRFGLTQLVFSSEYSDQAHRVAEELRSEYVVAARGTVDRRPEGTTNPNLATGEIEVHVDEVEVLNPARTPPFEISQDGDVDETLRLRYRYLDLRRERMRDIILLRHRVARAVRELLDRDGFVEVETPILVNRTPGGAREFLVPSRIHAGRFYALPQSPQQYKQLLMVAGMERYYQIARCFRDEDPRADRAPEFTQIDLEMSFVDQEDVLQLWERLSVQVAEMLAPQKRILAKPFPRLTFQQAMDRYGTDKPDLRFGLPIIDLTDSFGSGFQVFDVVRAGGGQVRGIVAPGCGGYSRREVDQLTELARSKDAKGLVTFALTPDEGIKGPVAKFFDAEQLQRVAERMEAETGDLLLIVADQPNVVAEALGELRLEIGRRLNLLDPGVLAFCWVLDMPAFEWDEASRLWVAKHHQFTMPVDEDMPLLDTNPGLVRAKQYDCVCNGTELAGGSIRIHRREIQEKIFRVIGMSDDEARRLFGHLLEAFEYGTPPHGGIASGLDRWLMLLADTDSLRETFAFPKTQSGVEPMTGAPSPVGAEELRDLHIRLLVESKAR